MFIKGEFKVLVEHNHIAAEAKQAELFHKQIESHSTFHETAKSYPAIPEAKKLPHHARRISETGVSIILSHSSAPK